MDSDNEKKLDRKARIAKVVNELKGERSIRRMAEDTDVAASYLTGILKERYLPSAEILSKLAAEDANPQNGITLEDLMIAAGYQTKYQMDYILDIADKKITVEFDTKEQHAEDSDKRLQAYYDALKQSRKEYEKYMKFAKGAILMALNEKHIVSSPVDSENIGIRGYKPDMSIYVSKQPILEWWFDFKYINKEDCDKVKNFSVVDYLGKYMFLDKRLERKITYVVNDEILFSKLEAYKNHLSYRGDLSIMLIDDEEFSIRREVYLSYYRENDYSSEFTITK